MGAANLLASSGQDVDFFIHGVFSYELFGQTFWITTTHVAIAIVMLLVVIFAIAARITISHAKKYPTGFQNIVEMIVEMLDKMVESSMMVPAFFMKLQPRSQVLLSTLPAVGQWYAGSSITKGAGSPANLLVFLSMIPEITIAAMPMK